MGKDEQLNWHVKIREKRFEDAFSCNRISDLIGFIKCRRITVKIDVLKVRSGVLVEAKTRNEVFVLLCTLTFVSLCRHFLVSFRK